MIRFFRTLRQRLLSENRLSKYLLYALGEIALVMIGILLALQVNDWNETRKERRQEQVLLSKLAQNLRDDIALLAEMIASDSAMYARLSRMSQELLDAQNIGDVDLKANALFMTNQFYPNRTALDNIISAGQIGLMRHTEMMDQLILYYSTAQNYMEGFDQSLLNYSRDIQLYLTGFDHIRAHPRLSKKTLEDYLQDPFLLNALYFKNGFLQIQIRNYQTLLSQAQAILELVEQGMDSAGPLEPEKT